MDIFSAGAALKAAIQIAEGLRQLHTEQAVEAARVDLLGKLIQAQQAVLELQEAVEAARQENLTLKEKERRLRDHERERERYALKDLGSNAFVHALKEHGQANDPAHYLRVHCFNRAERSVLQFAGHVGLQRVLECPACKSSVLYRDKADDLSPEVGRVPNRWDSYP